MEITRKIGIFNNKGGVAKTTSVINLAYSLQKQDKTVLVVDCDTQENCFMFFMASRSADNILPTDYEGISHSPKYGEVSAWDSFDLGEPTKLREELKDDEETDIPSAVDVETDNVQYADPEENVQPIEDLAEEAVQEAVMEMTEFFADAIADELLQDEDDYGMDMDML